MLMKKRLRAAHSLFVAAVVFAAACVFVTFPVSAYSIGDVDDSGAVSVSDVLKVRDHILQVGTALTDDEFSAADVNANDKVDLIDLLMIRDHVLGIRELVMPVKGNDDGWNPFY